MCVVIFCAVWSYLNGVSSFDSRLKTALEPLNPGGWGTARKLGRGVRPASQNSCFKIVSLVQTNVQGNAHRG